MTISSDPLAIARSYWDAESRRDLHGVLEHYDADAVFQYPGGRLQGHQEISTYYDQSGIEFPGLEVTILHAIVKGDEATIEWEAVMIDSDGGRHPLKGVNVIQVAGGKFVSVHAYFDPATLRSTID